MEMLFEEMAERNNSFLLNNEITNLQISKTMNLQNEILTIFNNLAEDPSWSFENLSRKETSYATHGYHKYPAKFIPQLARRCIEDYSKEDENVCDPFMGCGTTLVEALVSGRKAVGVDINPVTWLITKAKAVPIEPEKLKKEADRVLLDISAFIEFKRNKIKPLTKVDIESVIPDNERINIGFHMTT